MRNSGGKSRILGTFLIWLVTGLLAVGIVFSAIVISRNEVTSDTAITKEESSSYQMEGGLTEKRLLPTEKNVSKPDAGQAEKEKRKAEPGTLAGVLDGYFPHLLSLSGARINKGLRFPLDYTCYRSGKSPAVSWEGLPAGTKSLALLLVRHRDDEGSVPFVNWGIYNIDPASDRLVGSLPNEIVLENGMLQIRNDHRNFGYTGPCEPKGKFPYSFYLFALDTKLPVGQEIEGSEFYDLLKGHVLDYNEIKVVHYLQY